MTPIAPKLYHTVRGYAGRIKAAHEEFRMAHFMYSLPEDRFRGWPLLARALTGKSTRKETAHGRIHAQSVAHHQPLCRQDPDVARRHPHRALAEFTVRPDPQGHWLAGPIHRSPRQAGLGFSSAEMRSLFGREYTAAS